jgi:Cadherin-like beta sandwich domain
LDPEFSSDTLSYRVTVASDVERVTISATKSDPNALMSALGSIIAAVGTQTGQVSVPLRGRRTEVDLTVTAQDGVTTRSYTIFIRTRQ